MQSYYSFTFIQLLFEPGIILGVKDSAVNKLGNSSTI